MDYNKSLRKDICPYIVDNIISVIGDGSDDWVLNVDTWKLKLATKDYDYFKNQGKSCLAELIIDYSIFSKKGGPVRKESVSLFIPQMVKSSFVIDGKTRTHESYFDKCHDLNIGPTKIFFDGVTYDIPKNVVNFYIKGLGFQSVEIDKIHDKEVYTSPEYYEKLKLTPVQRKKIRIIYGFDPGTKITKEALMKMADSYTMSMRDHVVTKQLLTADRALHLHLEKSTRKVVRTMNGQFYKNQGLYPAVLQSTIYNFFKGRSESVNPIHFPDHFNELSYLIASKRVIMETGSGGHVSKTRFNPTFFDVVDAAVSPDGPKINKINELAQAVEVNADGSVNIKVYNKKFEIVSIELLDYMLSNILHYEEVDYHSNKVISSKGPWKVKFRGETKENTSYDYIDLHPDERLATTTRMIPMTNSCDSVRVSMSAKMLKQSISTKSSEPPLIATGHENIKDQSPLVSLWKLDEPGKVVESDVFNGIVKVEDSNGKIHKFNIPTPIEAQKRTSMQFIPAEKGERLKKGDIIYRSMNLAKDGQLSLGQNLRTAFMYWRGLEFEDSVVISKTCSKKLTHIGEHIMFYDIREGELLKTIAEPGDRLDATKKDSMITVERELSYTRAQEGLNTLIRTPEITRKLVGMKVPNNVTDAMIIDVDYFEVKRDAAIAEKLNKVKKLNYKDSPESKYASFKAEHGEFPARKLVVPESLPKGEDKGILYRVYFKMVIASPAKNGDKVTNRFGSKGVIGGVIDDAEMPRTADGKVIDIIINPSSVIARKNLPQTSEAILSRISDEIWKRVDRMSRDKDKFNLVQDLLKKYHFMHLAKMSHSKFWAYHDSLSEKDFKYQVVTGAFSKYSPMRVAEIQEDLQIDDREYLFDGKRGRRIKNPIMTGWTYILKLHHSAEFQNKLTANNPKDRNPLVLGLGEIRNEGQKIGEMESMSLMIHDATDYLKEVRGNSKSDWFLVNMIQSSQVLIDKNGKALLTEVSNTKKIKNNYD